MSGGAVAAWAAIILAAVTALGAGLWRLGRAVWEVAPIITAAAAAAPQVDTLTTTVAELAGEVRGWREATDRRLSSVENRLNSLNGSTPL